jgi:hypothetical protein
MLLMYIRNLGRKEDILIKIRAEKWGVVGRFLKGKSTFPLQRTFRIASEIYQKFILMNFSGGTVTET